MPSDREADGKFAIRPAGAAPLFDSESAALASHKRWEKHNERSRQAIIEYAAEKLGYTPDFEDAYEFVVSNPQFKASQAGKTAAAKFVREEVGLAKVEADRGTNIDNRQITISPIIFTSRQHAMEMVKELEASGRLMAAASIREQINEDVPLDEFTVPLG